MATSSTLVLCVDRDDDIGRKTGIRGPIIGLEENIEAAKRFALEDPEDTDVNAIFAAAKIARKIGAQVVTLTGDVDVGLVSDEKIAKQLDKVVSEFKPDSVILVTDGAGDEQLVPIIQSRVKIDAVQTVVVRQSQELEKAYFQLTNFLKEISNEPHLARLLFGIPGLALLLLALGGVRALNAILGVVGIYFIIRGLGLEEEVFGRISNFIKSLSVERISTLVYSIAVVALAVGVGYAYSDLQRSPLNFRDLQSSLDTMSMFMLGSISIDVMLIGIIIAIIGRMIDDYPLKKYLQIMRHLRLIAFLILVRTILGSGASFWSNEDYGLGNFLFTVIVGVSAFYLWIKITKYLFIGEIQSIQTIVENLVGREVQTTTGELLGRVSKVFIEGMELGGLKVGKIRISKDEIVSTAGNVITVQSKKNEGP